jgi:hypothetical protein
MRRTKRIKGSGSFWDFQSSVGRASSTYNRFSDNILGYIFYLFGFMFIIAGMYEVVKGKDIATQDKDKDKKAPQKPKSDDDIREEGFIFIAVGLVFMIIGHVSIWTGKYIDKQVSGSKSAAAVYGTATEANFLFDLFNSN